MWATRDEVVARFDRHTSCHGARIWLSCFHDGKRRQEIRHSISTSLKKFFFSRNDFFGLANHIYNTSLFTVVFVFIVLRKKFDLQQRAGARFSRFLGWYEHRSHGFVKHRLQVLAGLCRAFDVVDRLYPLGELHALSVGDRLSAHFLQIHQRRKVVALIGFRANQYDRRSRAKVKYLRIPIDTIVKVEQQTVWNSLLALGSPFGGNVFKRCRVYDRKANQKHVCVCIRQRSVHNRALFAIATKNMLFFFN